MIKLIRNHGDLKVVAKIMKVGKNKIVADRTVKQRDNVVGVKDEQMAKIMVEKGHVILEILERTNVRGTSYGIWADREWQWAASTRLVNQMKTNDEFHCEF